MPRIINCGHLCTEPLIIKILTNSIGNHTPMVPSTNKRYRMGQ